MFAIVLFLSTSVVMSGEINYTIDWFSVTSSRGMSSGGCYTFAGSAGQFDAGDLGSVGGYSLREDFFNPAVVNILPTGNETMKLSPLRMFT